MSDVNPEYQFVPYCNRALKKAVIDCQLDWMWNNDIKPQIGALMENFATGDKVIAGNWPGDRIFLNVGVNDVKHYTTDDDAIYFECSINRRKTQVVIPYSCIAAVQSVEAHWIDTKVEKLDPYWVAFPMAIANQLNNVVGVNAELGAEPQVVYNGPAAKPATPKVEVPVAEVKSVEGNVVHVQFGKKK